MICLFWVVIFYTACKVVSTNHTMCSGNMEYCGVEVPDSGCHLKTYCNLNICETDNTNCISCKDIPSNNENNTDLKSLVKYNKKIFYTDGNGQVQQINGTYTLLQNVYPVLWANKFLFINKSIVYEEVGDSISISSVTCWFDDIIGENYVQKKELHVSPKISFMAGQKRIEIIFPSGIRNNFSIFMDRVNKTCYDPRMTSGNLSCTLPAIDSEKKQVKTNLTFIQDYVRYFIQFEYLENPVVELGDRNSSYFGGGSLLEFQVTHLSHICSTCAELSSSADSTEKCTQKGDETIECLSPFINATDTTNNSSEKILILKLDNYKVNVTLHYYLDPEFEKASLKDQIIHIKGKRLDKAAEIEEYIIIVDEKENCTIKSLESNLIKCKVQDGKNKGNVTVELHGKTWTLKILNPENNVIILVGAVIIVIMALIVLAALYKVIGRKKKRTLSIPPDDNNGRLMSLIVQQGIPFQKPSDYIKRILGSYKPPDNIRHNTKNLSENLKHSLRPFGDLLKNKYFLLPILKALEKDKSLTRGHRYTYAYHLSLLFSSDLRYFLELCEELFCHLASENRGLNGKKLMSSCSSITEYMILNWLSISMHSYMKENIGDLLYFFTHKVKNYLEKMPIDEVTGNSYQSIFDRYRLKMSVQYEEINIQAEMRCVTKTVPIFTSDSIVQLKKKCLAAFYCGKPASEIPDIDDICIEYHRNRINEFKTEENNKGFTKHLTTYDWNIEEGDLLRLTFANAPQTREVDADVRYTTLGASVARITTKSKRKFIHLQEPENPKTERPFTETDFKKMELPVCLEYKLIQLIYKFLNRGKKSAPQCCLYNLFKKAAKKNGTEKTWMINSFFIQFCCQFIAKPDILLDISQEIYMKKNLEGMKNYTAHILKRCLSKPSKDPELHENITNFWTGFPDEDTHTKDLMVDLQSISDGIKRDASFSKEHSIYYIFIMMKANYAPIMEALTKDEKATRLQLGDKFLAEIEQIERISIRNCED